MVANINDIKSKRQEYDYRIKIIAKECGCSARQVRNILGGVSGNRRITELAERVKTAYRLLLEGEEKACIKIRQMNKMQNK